MQYINGNLNGGSHPTDNLGDNYVLGTGGLKAHFRFD